MHLPKLSSAQWRAFREWATLVIAIVGLVFGVVSLNLSRKTATSADGVATEQDLAAAWDILGGQKGTMLVPSRGRVPAYSDLMQAQQRIASILARDTDNTTAHWLKGICYQFRGKLEEAEIEYRFALRSKEDRWRVYDSLGNLLVAKGDIDGAIAAYGDALKYKASETVYYNLGLAHLTKNDLARATSAFDTAVANDPYFAEAYLALAEVLRRQGRRGEAAAVAEQAKSVPVILQSRIERPVTGGSALLVDSDESPGVASADAVAVSRRVSSAETINTESTEVTPPVHVKSHGTTETTTMVGPLHVIATDTSGGTALTYLPGMSPPAMPTLDVMRQAPAEPTFGNVSTVTTTSPP